MAQTISSPITLEEFLTMPTSQERYELIEGDIVAKMAPQRFHSKTQRALLHYLEQWGESRGEVGIEWSVILQRRGKDWVPIPDLLFVSQERLPENLGDEPCPVPPNLAIEIISPSQTFGEMAEKVMDYLNAGVLRVWVVDPQAQSITVFAPDAMPITYRGEETQLTDIALPGLSLTPHDLFTKAGLT